MNVEAVVVMALVMTEMEVAAEVEAAGRAMEVVESAVSAKDMVLTVEALMVTAEATARAAVVMVKAHSGEILAVVTWERAVDLVEVVAMGTASSEVVVAWMARASMGDVMVAAAKVAAASRVLAMASTECTQHSHGSCT